MDTERRPVRRRRTDAVSGGRVPVRVRLVALVAEPELIVKVLGALGLDPKPPARAPPMQPSFVVGTRTRRREHLTAL